VGVGVLVTVGVGLGIVPAQSLPHESTPPTKSHVQPVPQVPHAASPSDVQKQVMSPEQFDVQQPFASAARGVSTQARTTAAAQPKDNSAASRVRVCFAS
jgi:hypothetical protein